MSNQNKFFIRKNIDPKEGNILGITAVNISDKHLVIGDDKGNLISYEFGTSERLIKIKSLNHNNSKIEKILVPPLKKMAFALANGELFYVKLPTMDTVQSLIKKDTINAFLNNDDPDYKNAILTINRKKKLKIQQYDIVNELVNLQEKKMPKEPYVEDFPKCALWTARNYFVYFIPSPDGRKGKNYWLKIEENVRKFNDMEGIVEICSLGDKVAVSNELFSLFMVDGSSYQYNILTHKSGQFKSLCTYKNNLFALSNNIIEVYKPGKQEYEFVDSLPFENGETAAFIVASNYKLVVVSETDKKFHFTEFQEKSFEEQITILLNQKLYDNALEKLIGNITDQDIKRQEKIEALFLDCAWACLEGLDRDYDRSIKFIRLTNFNPFEFIYMFYDSLNVNIIHIDKADEIKKRKNDNKFFGLNAGEEEQNKAFKYLVSILKSKRDYILEKIVKPDKSIDIETKKIKFESSKRSKIYLGDSTTETSIMDVFYAINTALIKSLIKLKADPKEIEAVLDNESIDISKFDDFEKEKFFTEDENKDLVETKFTLSYITEKKGINFEMPLRQWEEFGKSNNEKYSLIGKERTKKIFYKFQDNNIDIDVKQKLIKKYIKWLLEKYQTEAFEVVNKTELISNKNFLENIIPDFAKNRPDCKAEDLKVQFLEYCNEDQKNVNTQTQLLQLYADRMFKLAKKDSKDVKIEGEIKKYYDLFTQIIESEDSVYNKKIILEYIEKSWLIQPKIYLYSKLNEHDKALKELFNQAKITGKYKDIEKFCQQIAYTYPEIYQDFYKLLSQEVRESQEKIDKNLEKIVDKKIILEKNPSFLLSEKAEIENEIKKLEDDNKSFEQWKEPFEKEMLNLLEKHGKIDEINPIKALELANEHWNVCDKNNEFFNYLINVIKEYTYNGNKYKMAKQFSEIGLVYKEKEAYEFKKKNVTIDSDKSCDLCKKKIGTTIFVIYPNMKVYHSKCAPNLNIDPVTGVDFTKKKYVE